ncbi:MAG: hypothetical protein HYU52_03415 [Acidobacteria bacterium]|nr:hypothetical protein [Acidobacteriota bacterium]
MRHPITLTSVLVIALLSIAAFGLLAQETPAPAAPSMTTALTPEETAKAEEASALEEKKMSDVAVDFKAIFRMAEFCDNLEPCAPVIRKVVEQNLDMLREPRSDGSYRWASFQRVEAGRISDEKEILKVSTEATLDTIELAGKHSFSVVVTAPRKRSLISANNKIFVRDVIAEITSGDGKIRTAEIPVGVWVNPGDSHSVPLDEIAASARVKVNIGVESGTKKAVASVALLQAGLVDDPLNPHHPAVKRLNVLNSIVKEKPVNRGQLKATAEEAVLELPGEMEKLMKLREIEVKRMRELAEGGEATGVVAIGDATPDVVHELGKAAKLLSGTLTEQEEGRKMLDSLIQQLSPPPPPAPPVGAPKS